MIDPPPISKTWASALQSNPLPALLGAPNPSIAYFARRDLLGEVVVPVEKLWVLRGAQQLLRRQMTNGARPCPGGGKLENQASEDYAQLETYRNLAFLVEKYGFDRRRLAIQAAPGPGYGALLDTSGK